MSKLIVEMEMPKACRWKEDGTTKRCPIAEWGGACAVTKQFEPSYDNRPPWCPIKGVLPKTHGRLIDASTVIGVQQDEEGNDFPVTVDDYLGLQFPVPAIVPATERIET